mgnify:CR=1 FL=1
MGILYDLISEPSEETRQSMREKGYKLRLYNGKWYVIREDGGGELERHMDRFLALCDLQRTREKEESKPCERESE